MEAVRPTGLPNVFAMPIFLGAIQTDPVDIVVLEGAVSDLACNPNRASDSMSLQVGERRRFLKVFSNVFHTSQQKCIFSIANFE